MVGDREAINCAYPVVFLFLQLLAFSTAMFTSARYQQTSRVSTHTCQLLIVLSDGRGLFREGKEVSRTDIFGTLYPVDVLSSCIIAQFILVRNTELSYLQIGSFCSRNAFGEHYFGFLAGFFTLFLLIGVDSQQKAISLYYYYVETNCLLLMVVRDCGWWISAWHVELITQVGSVTATVYFCMHVERMFSVWCVAQCSRLSIERCVLYSSATFSRSSSSWTTELAQRMWGPDSWWHMILTSSF